MCATARRRPTTATTSSSDCEPSRLEIRRLRLSKVLPVASAAVQSTTMESGLGSRELHANIEVVTLAADERRMLLEILASERAGEEALHVGEQFGRNGTGRRLVELRMAHWVARDRVVFTGYGRHLAESLAARLIRAPDPDAS